LTKTGAGQAQEKLNKKTFLQGEHQQRLCRAVEQPQPLLDVAPELLLSYHRVSVRLPAPAGGAEPDPDNALRPGGFHETPLARGHRQHTVLQLRYATMPIADVI
jgi:hypothetical protein